MQTSIQTSIAKKFPPFDLARLLKTVFQPQTKEKICILTDLENPSEVTNFAFLKHEDLEVQKKAYDIFYRGIQNGIMQTLGLTACDFFAYKTTGGSNLELPETAIGSDGKTYSLAKDIFPTYQIILCITTFSATAPLTAAAKAFGFRGATMHGVNNVILQTGLAVDYNEVSKEAEKLRLGMTQADGVSIDFEANRQSFHLDIELNKQEAQKSHGLCPKAGDIVNLPAGEVYFVPTNAKGSFPTKFDDGTLGIMEVENGKIKKTALIQGNQKTIDQYQEKFTSDPASAILGELGFGTQVLPYSGRDIQDEKIFGTFHLATGRNDHLNGSITLNRFNQKQNATHDDILFSSTKTPEIQVKSVKMNRQGKWITLIENYEPSAYLWNLIRR